MRLLDRLERKFRPYAVPNVTIVIIMGQVLAFILSQSKAEIVGKMVLVPQLVMDGEIWRLGSFCFVPPDIQPLFLFFAMMIFDRMGSALEQIWGAARYNLFLICGYLTTVAAAFFAASAATNMFIGTSVFLAFAWLYPNHIFYIMFILPVKVRWLALLAWIGLIYGLLIGDMQTKLFILAGITNFLLFFGQEVILRIRSKGRQMQRTAEIAAEAGKPKHECVVCGATDKSDSTLEFRYCSKCEGALCYCENHLRNHDHVGNVEA